MPVGRPSCGHNPRQQHPRLRVSALFLELNFFLLKQRLPCALTNAPKPGDKTTMRYGLPASWWPGPATG